MPPVRRQISPHASDLRRAMTDAETKLWLALRDRRLDGFKFRRQSTIGPYIVDFLCAEAKLIVELDGGQHSKEVDTPRTRFFEERGYRVIRFWNNDVLGNFEGVLQTISTTLANLKEKTLIQPSPASGRRLT